MEANCIQVDSSTNEEFFLLVFRPTLEKCGGVGISPTIDSIGVFFVAVSARMGITFPINVRFVTNCFTIPAIILKNLRPGNPLKGGQVRHWSGRL
jgi:hypothetical protein